MYSYDENRMEFFYYEDCGCAVAVTHNKTIIACESYCEQSDNPYEDNRVERTYLYLYRFVNLDEIDWWIN